MAEGADAKEKEGEKGTGGEEECGGDEGHGKVSKSKHQKKKKDGDGNKKAAVVLGVDLHCDGCARKVVKAIRAVQGVEGVAADVAAWTVTVRGKGVDPWDLKERVESRTHRPVAFVSPPNPPKKEDAAAATATAEGKKCSATDGKGKSTAEDDKKKKDKEPPESTVVVKMGLHCNGCIDRVKRTAHKIKGVKQVTVDAAKEHVTVQGTMDAKALPDVLRGKLRRDVALVVLAASQPAKTKDGSAGDKKNKKQPQQQQDGGEGADKVAGEQPQQGGGGVKNKQEEKEDGGAVAKAWAEQAFPMAMMYGGGGGDGWTTSYRVEMLHAPQLFSDENPNACAVM